MLWEIDAESGAAAFFAGDGDGSVMIADDGLNDGEAEARALQLGGVVGSEEARALFGSEAFAGVGNLDANGIVAVGSAKSESAAGRHGIQSIQHQVLESAMEQVGIRINFRERFVEEILRGDRGLADSVELRFEEANGVAERFVDIDASELRARASWKNR